jgi:hypothetical protein
MLRWQRLLVLVAAPMLAGGTGALAQSSGSVGEVRVGPMAFIHGALTRGAPFILESIATSGRLHLLLSLVQALVCLSAFYGLVMGFPGGWRQCACSALKLPMLLLLSLCVCFPAMAVLVMLIGLPLDSFQVLNLLLSVLVLNAVVLASLAPIAWFFGTTSDYHFVKLTHVAFFGSTALYSMWVLLRALLLIGASMPDGTGASMRLFLLWLAAYGFVGCQMAWLLRPFIGAPGLPFEFIRRRTGGLSFYTAVLVSVRAFNTTRGHIK